MKANFRDGILLSVIILGLLLAAYLAVQLVQIALLVLTAVVLTTGIEPLVARVQRRGISRLWATLIVMVFGGLIVLGLVTTLAVFAVQQSGAFVQSALPDMQNSFKEWLAPLAKKYSFLPQPDALFQEIRRASSAEIVYHLKSATQAVFGVLGGLLSVLFIFVLTAFFTFAKQGIAYTLSMFIPPRYHDRTCEIAHLAAEKMGGWLRGQLTLALLLTGIISVGMSLFGITEYAILLGIIGGMGEMIPMVGPYAALVPAIIIALVLHFHIFRILGMLLFFMMLSWLEAYYLSPRVMRHNVNIHPVTTVLSLVVGSYLFGILGALLAIPVAAATRVILLEAVFPAIQQKSRQEIEAGRVVVCQPVKEVISDE